MTLRLILSLIVIGVCVRVNFGIDMRCSNCEKNPSMFNCFDIKDGIAQVTFCDVFLSAGYNKTKYIYIVLISVNTFFSFQQLKQARKRKVNTKDKHEHDNVDHDHDHESQTISLNNKEHGHKHAKGNNLNHSNNMNMNIISGDVNNTPQQFDRETGDNNILPQSDRDDNTFPQRSDDVDRGDGDNIIKVKKGKKHNKEQLQHNTTGKLFLIFIVRL